MAGNTDQRTQQFQGWYFEANYMQASHVKNSISLLILSGFIISYVADKKVAAMLSQKLQWHRFDHFTWQLWLIKLSYIVPFLKNLHSKAIKPLNHNKLPAWIDHIFSGKRSGILREVLLYSYPCNLRPLHLAIPSILRLTISDTTLIYPFILRPPSI